MVGMLGMLVRVAAATVFVVSAGWKLAEPAAFGRGFRGLAPRGLRFAVAPARYFLVAVETLSAAALLVGIFDRVTGVVGAIAALFLLVSFSTQVARARGFRECGCWAMPFVADGDRVRGLILVRNGILAIFLVTVAFTPAEPNVAALVGGVVVGLLTVEAPQLIAVATYHRVWMAAR